MTISLWIIVGMIAAWLARHAVPEDSSDGMLQNLIMGVIGALAGGWIFHTFGRLGGSSVGALTGAVLSLWAFRALTRRWTRVHA